MPSIEEIIKGIDQLREELANIRRSTNSESSLRTEKVKTWTRRAYDQLYDWGFAEEAEEGFGRSSFSWMLGTDSQASQRDNQLHALGDDLASHPDHYASRLSSTQQVDAASTEPAPVRPERVFLGHGRNSLWARVQVYLKDDLQLDVEAWESEPRAGRHSVDVLEGLLNSCTFAVIVATGEDATPQGGIRARQNVVHEIGLFQGRIGFKKVALLLQEGIEEFSNLAGLQVIPFAGEMIQATFYDLGRMLKREGVVKP